MREVVAGVLLFAGVALELAAALGVVSMRGVLQRIHYTGLAIVGAIPIAAAVVVRESFSLASMGPLLLCAYLLASGPALAHVTARAAGVPEEDDG
ncbi:MAG: monovalent cation/H(+) antiporter subunit G [Actinobacteria bacterium]|nr:MAG: monovalent cation/H(+) antiporter subunit G [Actinomycetota bacterium]